MLMQTSSSTCYNYEMQILEQLRGHEDVKG